SQKTRWSSRSRSQMTRLSSPALTHSHHSGRVHVAADITTTFANRATVKGERHITAANDSEKNYSGGRVNVRERPIIAPGRQPSDKAKEITLVKDYRNPVEAKYKVVAGEPPEGGKPQATVDVEG